MQPVKCTHCDQDAVAPDIITPPLCVRHYDIMLLISRAQRFDLPVTPANLTDLMKRANGRTWNITPAEILPLLREVLA